GAAGRRARRGGGGRGGGGGAVHGGRRGADDAARDEDGLVGVDGTAVAVAPRGHGPDGGPCGRLDAPVDAGLESPVPRRHELATAEPEHPRGPAARDRRPGRAGAAVQRASPGDALAAATERGGTRSVGAV